ncbi:hypothetical protein [Burkholderia vietnamiensis]|uniref:hypothetical protein n=1 Tax=Burkholderia vietnamiensis TaxID=60552 RepID=UPI001CF5D3AF|nr:hypothetical protein [Burkholderia vietnamiensis]MCA8228305.1 hypothetical protein [Burkholderia vietnamiensis]
MICTVIAHFGIGKPALFPDFPEDHVLRDSCAHGQVYVAADGDSGGFIVAEFDTEDDQVLLDVYEAHLKDNDLKVIALHRSGDTTLFKSKTKTLVY